MSATFPFSVHTKTTKMALQFAASDDSDSDSDLPFPAPLARDAFSSIHADFSPHAFLASLRNRHQTLEDLRAELRTRSKDLEAELVELVNRDYADFVGLGGSVKGGEGKVEDLKVGLLGFRREVAGIVSGVEATKRDVEVELRKKETIRKQKTLARNLLSFAQRLDELSSLLLLNDGGDGTGPPGFLEDGEGLTSIRRLRKLVGSWVYLVGHLLSKIPKGHPFVRAQEEKVKKVKDTLLIDLGTTLKEVKQQGDVEKCLEVMGLYADMKAENEAVKILKELKR